MGENGRIFFAEAVGTAVLVIGGVGTAVLAGDKVGYLGVALAFGLSLLCMAYAIGHISGCHINPAITTAMAVLGKTPANRLPAYFGGQILGGLLGALVIFLVASQRAGFSVVQSGFASNGYGAHSPGGYNLLGVAIAEIVVTALFALVVASTTGRSFPTGFGGIAAGLALALAHLITIPVSNTSVNPARSIATAVFQHTWALQQLWAFIVFPLIGGALAGLLWRALSSEPATATTAQTESPASDETGFAPA